MITQISPCMRFLKTENYLHKLIGSNHNVQFNCSSVSQNAWNTFPMAFPQKSCQIWLKLCLIYDYNHIFVHRILHMIRYDYLVISIPTTVVIFAWFSCSSYFKILSFYSINGSNWMIGSFTLITVFSSVITSPWLHPYQALLKLENIKW
jgi:hypothetical protein